jgi:hypothetical protein
MKPFCCDPFLMILELLDLFRRYWASQLKWVFIWTLTDEILFKVKPTGFNEETTFCGAFSTAELASAFLLIYH